jgi:hypothetical protein
VCVAKLWSARSLLPLSRAEARFGPWRFGRPGQAPLTGARRCEEVVEHLFTTGALRRRNWKRKGIFSLCLSASVVEMAIFHSFGGRWNKPAASKLAQAKAAASCPHSKASLRTPGGMPAVRSLSLYSAILDGQEKPGGRAQGNEERGLRA